MVQIKGFFPELFVTPYNWQDNGDMRQKKNFNRCLFQKAVSDF